MIVLLLDREEKLYNFFPNMNDDYWGRECAKISGNRYACHYTPDEATLLSRGLIPKDYKEDVVLHSRILSLSHRNK